MKNLKTFSTTRFPNSMRSVFDTLIEEFKPVVKCLEDISENDANAGSEAKKRADEAKTILRKIKSRSFVLQLSGTSDIYEIFESYSLKYHYYIINIYILPILK